MDPYQNGTFSQAFPRIFIYVLFQKAQCKESSHMIYYYWYFNIIRRRVVSLFGFGFFTKFIFHTFKKNIILLIIITVRRIWYTHSFVTTVSGVSWSSDSWHQIIWHSVWIFNIFIPRDNTRTKLRRLRANNFMN